MIINSLSDVFKSLENLELNLQMLIKLEKSYINKVATFQTTENDRIERLNILISILDWIGLLEKKKRYLYCKLLRFYDMKR